MITTIHGEFEKQVKRTPNKIAVLHEDQYITYDDLNKRANQISERLLMHGDISNRIVGLMLERSLDMVCAILGILKAGYAYLPIEIEYPVERVNYMLNDSGTEILIKKGNLHPQVVFNGMTIDLSDDSMNGNLVTNVNKSMLSTELAYVIYTSGSTGKPKGVMIEHKSVLNLFEGITEKVEFSDKCILALSSFSFDILVVEMVLPLVKGMRVVLTRQGVNKNPRLLKETIIKHQVDILQLTPSSMQLLLNDPSSASCLERISILMIGGEALHPTLLENVKVWSKARIFNLYGPTETTVWSSVKEVTYEEKVNIGTPILRTRMYILGDNNQLLKIGQIGELCISGEGLARGYINNVPLTEKKFLDGIVGERIYKTGDLAKKLPNGEFELHGRIDHQVKIRGHRVEINEVENMIIKHGFVREAVVFARESADGNLTLYAILVSDITIGISALRAKLLYFLPDYLVPSIFIQIDRLPLTESGKVDRNKLKELHIEGTIPINEKTKPHCNLGEIQETVPNDTEKSIVEIVTREICRIAERDITILLNQELSDVGINSIQFIKLIVQLEMIFNFTLDDEMLLFENFSTINKIASYIPR